MQNILFGPSSTLPCLQKQSGCQAERMVLAARYPSRWAMRPHLLRVQMHRVCKEQRGQAEGRTYFETSCFRLPDCMHAQALCAVADSFAATQHHQPPVEHWRYAPLDLTCLSVLRSARCRYCSSPPRPSHLRYKDERVSETFRGWDAGVLEQLPLFLQEKGWAMVLWPTAMTIVTSRS